MLEKQQSFKDGFLWKLKVSLQFTGRLQYIFHAILVLIMLVIAGVGLIYENTKKVTMFLASI